MVKELMNEKKILIASSVHVWFDTRIYYKEALSLLNAGFEVEIIAREFEGEFSPQVDPRIKLTVLKKSLSRIQAIKAVYQKAINSEADIIHLHDPELLYVGAKLKKKKSSMKVIFDMHENFPKAIESKEWLPKILRKSFKKIISFLEPKFLNQMSGVIFAEKSYKKDYSLQVKTVDIYNLPHDPGFMEHNKNALFTMTYVGGITKIRGAMEMIQLVHFMRSKQKKVVQLRLIGPIDEGLKKTLQNYSITHGIDQQIQFLGRLGYREIWEELRQTDLGLCLLHPVPNYVESLPTKFFEYMAAGVPIVASNFPLWEEFFAINHVGLTCSPYQIEQLAGELAEIIETDDLLKFWANEGRRRFLEDYCWEQEEAKLIAFYKEVSVK
ncbi:glycosyltransferase [Listeria aquatica]|uniref:glycosyltransferase n=1 Tax=Listeria aquatica TaxID=1494960 RepID=UPI0031F59097